MDSLTVRLPDDVLEEISQMAVKRKTKKTVVARDLLMEGLRMNALIGGVEKLIAYAEWNQSMVGEVARLICENDREKFSDYAQKVQAGYKATLEKSSGN